MCYGRKPNFLQNIAEGKQNRGAKSPEEKGHRGKQLRIIFAGLKVEVKNLEVRSGIWDDSLQASLG